MGDGENHDRPRAAWETKTVMATIRSIGKSPRSPHEVEQRFRELRLQLPPMAFDWTGAAPASSDDTTKGWKIGSKIFTGVQTPPLPSNIMYICTNNAAGAAVWQQMEGSEPASVVAGGEALVSTDYMSAFDVSLAKNMRATIAEIFSAALGAAQTYAASNVTTDRTYDANATTLDEIADVLGTLIADLRAKGIVA